MKNQNLKNLLIKFNAQEDEISNEVEVLTSIQGDAVRGGLKGCSCRKKQTVSCGTQYTHQN